MMEFPFPPRFENANVRRWMSETKDALDERFKTGTGSPEGVVTANSGAIFQRTDGGASTSLYVKVGDASNTGWVALS